MQAAKTSSDVRAIERRCEKAMPGYSYRFQAANTTARSSLFDRVGINETLFDDAEQTPELRVAEIVTKFDHRDNDNEKQHCAMDVRELNSAFE